MRRTTLLAALLLASTVAHGQETRQAPALNLKDVQGRSLRLSDYKGKVVLLNFWATWCPPCRAEMPDLVKMQRDYAKQGLQIVGITYPPETLSSVRRFTSKIKVNYPLALGTKESKSIFTEVETLPITVVIDRDGKIRDIIEGIMLPEEFEQKIKPLLKPAFGEKPASKQTLVGQTLKHRRQSNAKK